MSNVVIGIDIGFDSLKVVGLHPVGRGFRLVGMNHAVIPAGSWQTDELKNREEIAKTLVATLRSSKPSSIQSKKAMIALPESVIFSGTFAMPPLGPKELEQAIPFEVAEKLSINLEEYYIDYESTTSLCQPLTDEGVVNEPIGTKSKKESKKSDSDEAKTKSVPTAADKATTTTAVFAVAAKRTLVQSILELCELANIELAGLDIKPGAITRSVVPVGDRKIRLIIDLGASATGVSVVEGQSLRLTSSVPIGTKSFSDNSRNTLKTFQAKSGPIFDEILHITKFFENRVCPGVKIAEIIVTGGGSNIEGVAGEFVTQTGLSTSIGEPYKQVDTHHFPLESELSRTFADAIGLAMRTAGKGKL